MQISKDQRRFINSVLSIFETGRLPDTKSYKTISILADGAGFSYGKHQSTDGSGSLDMIVNEYVQNNGIYAKEIAKHVISLSNNESTRFSSLSKASAGIKELADLLSKAGEDEVMQRAQDKVFETNYYIPALNQAENAGCSLAISMLVLYDTSIHSGPGRIATHRNSFSYKSPRNGGNEIEWLKHYLNARDSFLMRSSNPLVRTSAYRVRELRKLLDANNYNLVAPAVVRGVTIY